jgi:sec-independent protein translocase protein TatB
MFDIGMSEALLIGALVLLFIPPEDLPELFRILGRWYAKIRRASDDLRRAFNAEVAHAEADHRREELEKRVAKVREQASPTLPPDAAPRPMPTAPTIAPPPESKPEEP